MTPTLRHAAQQALDYIRSTVDYKMGHPSACEAALDLADALAEQADQEPVAWEWRWFDTSPYTVTSGQWSEWMLVEPRNRLCTVEDSLNEFRLYIADGQRYELRALYTTPQPVEREPSAGGVLFAVEQAIQNGDCPWQIEQAFDEYEAERAHGIREKK